ncbi:MAG TPA: hypothetical protein VLQ45_31305, partial [Thermoanaerobaculia bacterium]|nr:hypothetical protein [Thermoanaerobaculia bacterium]
MLLKETQQRFAGKVLGATVGLGRAGGFGGVKVPADNANGYGGVGGSPLEDLKNAERCVKGRIEVTPIESVETLALEIAAEPSDGMRRDPLLGRNQGRLEGAVVVKELVDRAAREFPGRCELRLVGLVLVEDLGAVIQHGERSGEGLTVGLDFAQSEDSGSEGETELGLRFRSRVEKALPPVNVGGDQETRDGRRGLVGLVRGGPCSLEGEKIGAEGVGRRRRQGSELVGLEEALDG